MIIKVERLLNEKTGYHSDVLYLKCDTCGKEWSLRGNKKVYESRKTHACSKECHKISNSKCGKAHNLYIETMQKKYGCDNAFQSEEVKTQMKKHYLIVMESIILRNLMTLRLKCVCAGLRFMELIIHLNQTKYKKKFETRV